MGVIERFPSRLRILPALCPARSTIYFCAYKGQVYVTHLLRRTYREEGKLSLPAAAGP